MDNIPPQVMELDNAPIIVPVEVVELAPLIENPVQQEREMVTKLECTISRSDTGATVQVNYFDGDSIVSNPPGTLSIQAGAGGDKWYRASIPATQIVNIPKSDHEILSQNNINIAYVIDGKVVCSYLFKDVPKEWFK